VSEAELHVRGLARFVDDEAPPEGMLHGQVFGSPVARGLLRGLDLGGALGTPGVVAVLTAAALPPGYRLGPIVEDEELLAAETVEYAGQPLALVVADRRAAAARGARSIVAEIAELEVIVDPREAHARGLVLGAERMLEHGDVDAAWSRCDVVVEGRVDIGGQEHLYLETQRARAVPGDDGSMRVSSSTQSPYAVQRAVAALLGLPYHAVVVEVPRVGGGFGGKEDQATHWACLAALGAARTGRAVEIVLSRADDLTMTGKRHPYSSDFKLGLTKDGAILALEVRHFQNAGAFVDLSPAVLERTLFHSTNAYRVPNARIRAVACRTNLPPSTAFRGFGGPQGMFVMECALARAAEALGVPREELQARNLLRDGDAFPYGQVARGVRARATWDEAARNADLARLRAEVAAHNAAERATKLGLAMMPVCFGISFTKTFLNQASALVHVYGDGSVAVSTGGVEMGQGLRANLRAIAARALGIDVELVRVEPTSTRRIANMSPSAASATTDLNGFAALDAIEQILARLRGVAALALSGAPEGVTVRDGRVWVGEARSDWTWQALVRRAYLARVSLSAHGCYARPRIGFDPARERGEPFAYHVYGTAVVLVRLDVLRGTYEIVRVRIAHHAGRPVVPVVDRGQIEGGLVQGLGWMAMEDLRFDAQGICRTASLSTYKIPDVYFVPDDLDVVLLGGDEPPSPSSPYGSKAVGEPPLMYGLGLFFAVRDALRAARPGADFELVAPLTPERVLLGLHRDERESARGDLLERAGAPPRA